MNQKIIIGSDHAGFELKVKLIANISARGFEISDVGTFSKESVDYPDIAHALAKELLTSLNPLGIILCGSGNGVNIVVNKYQGIRSALCWNAEIATLARQHNDANVLALPARFISDTLAVEIMEAFLSTAFEGGRHQLRVNKI